jgi:hypothetical protein
MHDITLHQNQPIKHLMPLINHFKKRGSLVLKLKRTMPISIYGMVSNSSLEKIPFMVKF